MKSFFKNVLSESSSVYALFSFLYNWKDRYWQPLNYDDLQKLILIFASENTEVIFLQIGSNDGISNDPLNPFVRKHKWSGYCIEPVPENFHKLKQTYNYNDQIVLLNKALASSKSLKLYSVNSENAKKHNIDLPTWHSQLASFDRNLVVAGLNGIDRFDIIDEIEVNSISFTELINEFKIESVDLLHIDVEGADWIVLSSFPFKQIKPQIIIFEHNHLSLQDYKKAIRFLKSFNYKLFKVNTDTFAYLNHSIYKHELKNAYRIFKKGLMKERIKIEILN